MTRKPNPKRPFGNIRVLPSGKFQARYTGPDGRVYKAPRTFGAKIDAEAWLTDRRREIDREQWSPREQRPAKKTTTFGEYADHWLDHRLVKGEKLKPRTREGYRKILDQHIVPTFGGLPISSIVADDVKDWYAGLPDKPTMRAHSYSLLRTIMQSAVLDNEIDANPAAIRGAGSARRVHKVVPATLDEIATITATMPDRYSLMVLLASWCALRFGELTELRRKDIAVLSDDDDDDSRYVVIRVRRAVVYVEGERIVTTPKTDAGVRDVHAPPHLNAAIEAHLKDHTAATTDALLFPAQHGGHLAPAALYRHFYKARDEAGRSDLRWHDLRHSGAVLAAQSGATLAELMARLGHSTPAAAMRYQHAARGRDRMLAQTMSRARDLL